MRVIAPPPGGTRFALREQMSRALLAVALAVAVAACGRSGLDSLQDGGDGGGNGGAGGFGGGVTGGGSRPAAARGRLGGGGGGSLGGGAGGGGAGGGTGGGSQLPCHSLTQDACATRSDCAVDTCYFCSCTPTFEQCRPVTEPKYECPIVECPAFQCCDDSTHSCTNGTVCMPPGGQGCGTCAPPSCTADADCGAGSICGSAPCGCGPICVPDCTQTGCDQGQVCAGNGHCQALSCNTASDCPGFFDCNAGTCVRRGCGFDFGCGAGGFCVQGQCYDSQGTCQWLPG